MSAWTVSTKVNIDGLLEKMGKLDSIPEFMLEVAMEVAENVKQNIVREDVIDTGALHDSITAEQRGEDMTVVRDGVSYGVYQEFGANGRAARPFFTPAIENYGVEFERVFTRLK